MKLLALLMIAVSTISAMVSAQAVSDPGTVAVISALEHEWTEAQSSNNDRALDLIFDNSLIYVEYGRLVTKGAYLARIKTEASKVDQVVTESFQVHTFAGTAIVVGTYTEKEVKRGKLTIKGWRFVDTWVYKKNGWVLVAAGSAPILQ